MITEKKLMLKIFKNLFSQSMIPKFPFSEEYTDLMKLLIILPQSSSQGDTKCFFLYRRERKELQVMY